MKKIVNSTLFRLLAAVIIGLLLGRALNEGAMNIVVTLRHISREIIFFLVPIIVLTFVSSSIIKMGALASRMLTLAITLAYCSSIGAAFMSMALGYSLLPKMAMGAAAESSKALPGLIFELNIPPIMSVMSALVLAFMVGLAAIWTRSERVGELIEELQRMTMALIERVMIPLLPLFIATNFCIMSYEGSTAEMLPTFINIMGVVLIAHLVWLIILYTIATIASRRKPWPLLRKYLTPYLTAVGTMSSAATLPVALKAVNDSGIVSSRTANFSIPLLANIHLCGSILTEVFFIMAISQMLFGTLPSPSSMVLFILLLGVFAIGAPGVPGGTVIASLGIVVSIIGFNESATALLLAIFALQDSFGTACNVVGDGALTMMLDRSGARS